MMGELADWFTTYPFIIFLRSMISKRTQASEITRVVRSISEPLVFYKRANFFNFEFFRVRRFIL